MNTPLVVTWVLVIEPVDNPTRRFESQTSSEYTASGSQRGTT
ncbi:MAG TPA: hypothetical protein VGA66_05370 [Mycobacterium sp.]